MYFVYLVATCVVLFVFAIILDNNRVDRFYCVIFGAIAGSLIVGLAIELGYIGACP